MCNSILDTRTTQKVAEESSRIEESSRRAEADAAGRGADGKGEEEWLPRGLTPALRLAMEARMEALFVQHHPKCYARWRAMVEAKEEFPKPGDPEVWLPVLALSIAALVFLRAEQKIDWDDGNSPGARRLERNRVLLLKLVYRGVVARGEYVPQRLRSQKTASPMAASPQLGRRVMSSTAKQTVPLVEITPALEVACAARLRALLTKRCTTPEEQAIVDNIADGRSPRVEFITLCCVAAAGVWMRAQKGSCQEVAAFLSGTGDPESRLRAGKGIRRAIRLLSRMVKMGCVVRKAVPK